MDSQSHWDWSNDSSNDSCGSGSEERWERSWPALWRWSKRVSRLQRWFPAAGMHTYRASATHPFITRRKSIGTFIATSTATSIPEWLYSGNLCYPGTTPSEHGLTLGNSFAYFRFRPRRQPFWKKKLIKVALIMLIQGVELVCTNLINWLIDLYHNFFSL